MKEEGGRLAGSAEVAGLDAVGEERAMPARASASPPVAPLPEEVWSAPEPWRGTLWRAVKGAVLGGAGFYTIMQLMGERNSLTRAAIFGLMTAAMSLSASRSGNLIPSSPSRILGGVTVGVGLIAAATAYAKGGSLLDAAGVAAIAVFLGGVLIWMGGRSKRAEEALANARAPERVAPVLITREELAARLEANRAHNESETRYFMTRLSIGIATVMGLLAFPYARVFGADLPEWAGATIFFGMWGAFGLFARRMARRGEGIARRFGLVCAACGKPYFGAFVNMRLLKNLAEIGRCPRCGTRVVTEA